MADPAPAEVGVVEVVGCGMVGTSVALACRRAGVEVLLSDRSGDHVRTAEGLGAGRARRPGDRPDLVVVAVPPDHLGTVIAAALADGTAYVTDVGSIKRAPLAEVAHLPGAERYVGSHPMAGSERSGPLAASAALFDGRPWALVPHERSDPAALAAVAALARLCGATPLPMTPDEHDRQVARTSHLPHLMAALTASLLSGAGADDLALSGQGVRDVTRVAAGDPALYAQIVAGNAAAVLDLVEQVRTGLDEVAAAVRTADRAGLEAVLARGVDGHRRIPGKHGGPATPTRSVVVSVPDQAGELARLFADAGASDVSVEDVHIDHDPRRPVGLVELVVDADRAEELLVALESRGWLTHR